MLTMRDFVATLYAKSNVSMHYSYNEVKMH